MSQEHERIFYETMWRMWGRGAARPYPWWVQSYLRHWSDAFDSGLFESREGAFASNASYRYWSMVGLPDQDVEALVGQAGEVEPIYDQYSVGCFLFDPGDRSLHLPQLAGIDGRPSTLEQQLVDGYLPAVVTRYRAGIGVEIEQRALAARFAPQDPRALVLARLRARFDGAGKKHVWVCVAVSPWGPTGLQRHDRAGRFLVDRRLSHLRFVAGEKRVETNAGWGPTFDTPPTSFGVYGNGGDSDPEFYLRNNPYAELELQGQLNGHDWADDHVAGLCSAVFAWPVELSAGGPDFQLDIRMPMGNFALPDITAMAALPVEGLDSLDLWTQRLATGTDITLPARLRRYQDQLKVSRSHLVILADGGEIHPGPTIYDSFWVRDSSVEGIACALFGEEDLAETQFGTHYPRVFNRMPGRIGPASLYGFFGREHEKNDREWDSNGQALWAIGKFDRIMGRSFQFGNGLLTPYVIDGARWIRDNRSPFGLLHSGWSAEHLGDQNQPHYWDDFWAIAGLGEAARLAERTGAPPALTQEIWDIYDEVRRATTDSINWVVAEQRARGAWETYIPTGPGNVGDRSSTMVGAIAYFHPCRLYVGEKLGPAVDYAARMTLETIWAAFVRGGVRHDDAWNCFGPYLTLQLAHAFLLVGDVERAHRLLEWSLEAAGYARVSRGPADAGRSQQVVIGAWNEQHCYPVASNFQDMPDRSWYMGDIPHGWACAEYLLLLRDMMFFEIDEDNQQHIYLAPGLNADWLRPGEGAQVRQARTILDGTLSFGIGHDANSKRLVIDIAERPASLRFFVVPCRFGEITGVEVDGVPLFTMDGEPQVSRDARRVVVTYQ